MGITVSVQKPTLFGLELKSAETAGDVIGAIIAGILLYFINKSFLNNFPAYVSIVVGLLITIYLSNNYIAETLGFTLMADGFYKLIKEYVVVNS